MTAQRQRVHRQRRRVCHLHQRDPLRGEAGDRLDRIAAHADVKTVEYDAEIVAVGRMHDVPGGSPVLDMTAPGERLIADAHAVLAGKVRELREIRGGLFGIVDRLGRDIRAEAQKPRAEFMHQFELARRALEIAPTHRVRHRLKVAQRLQRDDFEPEVGRQLSCVTWLAIEKGQIVFEELDGAKARLGGGGKLAFQRAAHADGGDRPSEHPQSLLYSSSYTRLNRIWQYEIILQSLIRTIGRTEWTSAAQGPAER